MSATGTDKHPTEKTMDAIKRIALSKAVKVKQADRDEAGENETYTVDFVARVKGIVKVHEAEEYTPTASLPLKATLALFMRLAGVTGPIALDRLTEAMRQALEAEEKGEEYVKAQIAPEQALIDAAWRQVEAGLATLPSQTRNPKITTKLTATEVVEELAEM